MQTIVILHGSAKSNYDLKVRSIAQEQELYTVASLDTIRGNILRDVAKIRRANTAVASANYEVEIKDLFEPTERLEIWNRVIPGKERLIVTITKGK